MKFGFTSGLGGSAIDAHSGVKRPAWERPEARPTRFHWGWGSGCGPGLEPLPGSAEARQPAPRPRSHTGPPPRGAAGAARGRSSNFARSARRRLSRARTPNFARPSAARPAPQPARRAAPQPRSSSPRAGPVFTSGRGPGVAPAAAPAQEARSPVSQSAAKFRTMDSSEPAGSAGPVGSTQPRSRGPGHRCLRHRRSPPPPCRAASPHLSLPLSSLPPSAGLSRAATGRRAVVTTRADLPHAGCSRAPQCSTGPPGGAWNHEGDGPTWWAGHAARPESGSSGSGEWPRLLGNLPLAPPPLPLAALRACATLSLSRPLSVAVFPAGSAGTIKMSLRARGPGCNSRAWEKFVRCWRRGRMQPAAGRTCAAARQSRASSGVPSWRHRG